MALEDCCRFLGISTEDGFKTHLDPHIVASGVRSVLDHNVVDVKLLEKLHLHLEPYIRQVRATI